MLKWTVLAILILIGYLLLPAYSDSDLTIQYQLYTPENPTDGCYIDEDVSTFNKCAFNSSYETKFLIHGHEVEFLSGNYFEIIKDTLLEYDKYNVIIANWTEYLLTHNIEDIARAYIVGNNVANLINFITVYTGVNASSFHLIGHSLGSHISGVAGKFVPNLGRITGMDPAGLTYHGIPYKILSSTDAILVDVMHTSKIRTGTGYGASYPMGLINFYPNGGEYQPMCDYGNTFLTSQGVPEKIESSAQQAHCQHDAVLAYFNSSIFDCTYHSTKCRNYKIYELGRCNPETHQTNMMGFHCVKTPELKDHSKFYLNTSEDSPFC